MEYVTLKKGLYLVQIQRNILKIENYTDNTNIHFVENKGIFFEYNENSIFLGSNWRTAFRFLKSKGKDIITSQEKLYI